MSRVFFGIEKGIRILDENGITGVDLIKGSGAPGGDTGVQDDAIIGSAYFRTDSGGLYIKIADTNAASDWEKLGNVTIDQLSWRNEKVIAATGDTITAGSGIDPTAWTDNESAVDGDDMNIGDHIIGDVDGVGALFEVTAKVSATSITLAAASQAIADNDTFIVQNYLPDSPASQEGQAIVHFPTAGGAGIKIGDVNWDFATGINISSGYDSSTSNGPVTTSDSVESAIEKLEGDIVDALAALGISRGDLNFGTFTGVSFADNQTAKQLFQRSEVLFEQLRGVQVTGITAAADVDSVPVASVKACKWLVEAFEEATPANREAVEVYAVNDGTNVDDTVYAKIKLGSGTIASYIVDIDSGNMRLRASSGTAGITVTARRIEVVKSVL